MEIFSRIFREYGRSSMKCEASSSVGGGKSVSMLTKQRDRIVKKMKDRYERMKESGNFTKAQLAEARKNFIRVRNTANSYISQASKAVLNDNKGTASDLTQRQTWQQIDRSLYTNGRMGVTRAGQVGQYRDINGRGSANGGGSESTRVRRQNQGSFGASVGRSYNIQRKLDVMGRGNGSMYAGVRSGIKSKYSTNNKEFKDNYNDRNGLTGTRRQKRVTAPTTNRSRYEAQQLTSEARIKRYERRKAKYKSRVTPKPTDTNTRNTKDKKKK